MMFQNLTRYITLFNYYFLDKFPPLPSVIRIEVTNGCDLKCIICDRKAMKRKIGLMDFDLFKKIADNAIKCKIPVIGLNRFGEPLLNQNIVDMIRYCKKNGAPYVELTTNGTKLSKELSAKLIKSGLDSIAISMDGFTKETYEAIRIGANFNDVKKNVRDLLELKISTSSKIKIQLNYVVCNANKQEVRQFRNYWKDKVDNIWFMNT